MSFYTRFISDHIIICILSFCLCARLGSSHRRPKYIDTSDFVVHLKKLKPATKYEFAVMVTRNDRSSLYSFSTTNTTLEDGELGYESIHVLRDYISVYVSSCLG